MKTKPKAWLHGECILREAMLPKGAIQQQLTPAELVNDGEAAIIAASEVTGNHHVVDLEPGVEFFTHNSERYVNSVDKPIKVRCVIAERHSTMELPPGTYKIGFQKEYDYYAQEMKNVRD